MVEKHELDLQCAVVSLAAGCGIAASEVKRRFRGVLGRAAKVGSDKSLEFLLRAIESFASPSVETIYVSTPITSGLLHEYTTRREHSPVVSPRELNRRKAATVVTYIRERKSEAQIIDPTPLVDIPGWTQGDYHTFWASVIERLADQIVFVDGWQYSAGCSVEFVTAVRKGLPLSNEDLAPFTERAGESLLKEALRTLDPESRAAPTIRLSVEELVRIEGGAA